MDSIINAAARALAAGNPLRALDRVALRDDAPGLALRGIAMAQLGELQTARALLRRSARQFGDAEPLARARCVTAQSEVALALRELGGSAAPLDEAIETLDAADDRVNATHARLIRTRRWLVLGRLEEAAAERTALDLRGMPPMLTAVAQLVATELAIRRTDARAADIALDAAGAAAGQAQIVALQAEVQSARQALSQPAARLRTRAGDRPATLAEVQATMASDALVVDACRRTIGHGGEHCSLARRPVLFELAVALAEAWPGDASRDDLIARAFELTRSPRQAKGPATPSSWRARLRVEMGRLRKATAGLATVAATDRGYGLEPVAAKEVVVIIPPVDGEHAAVRALLSDGAPWSTSALALALGVSQRTIQRALTALQAQGGVRAHGGGRALRWLSPPAVGYTTALLLPGVRGSG